MKIELEGMEFHAYHGCLESERKNGNTFEVDFKGELLIDEDFTGDNLDDTADYGEIYDLIAQEMEIPSKLLEHVALRIGLSIAENCPSIGDFSIRVSKACPPVNGKCRWSRITLFRKDLENVDSDLWNKYEE